MRLPSVRVFVPYLILKVGVLRTISTKEIARIAMYEKKTKQLIYAFENGGIYK
ncbi:hypothetical protein SAMN04487943_105107 [Gracilibacillus orientalis]|uniref:Uncharacterized protein n=1 Tax=Gracilibacillus orientalis TaxID=334253 RepID=A0A1I4LMZ4_9BACI|nr:hypothetical protein SAMN04487943_105107 [Gracilibacillus orientalis]